MGRRSRALASVLVSLGVLGAITATASGDPRDRRAHEVWAIDQSDTTADGGGSMHIYRDRGRGRSDALADPAEVIDLGGAARSLCLAETGTAPQRPHMLAFSGGDSHAIIAFVATGHVLFMDAASRTPVRCIDAGVQAHAAFPTPDDRYVVVANQNGKLLQRIRTDFRAGSFEMEDAATLNLATCTTPSGDACQDPVLRPDNAPICPVIERGSRFTFVTLRGGGMLVVDTTATPMAIVAEYDRATVHPNGCGGLEVGRKLYLNAGGGTPANPLEADLYSFPVRAYSSVPRPRNTPAPSLIFTHDARGFVDSHGATLTRHGRYLWVADRAANRIVVVDSRWDLVVNEIPLAGSLSADPAPDLLGVSPAGDRVYMTLRGPRPLTANVPGVDNAVGATPGVGVVDVTRGGRSGRFRAVAPISHVVGGSEVADPHGIGVRRVGRGEWKRVVRGATGSAPAGSAGLPASSWAGDASRVLCGL